MFASQTIKLSAGLLFVLACAYLWAVSPAGAQSSSTIRKRFFQAVEAEPNFGPYDITADVRYGAVTLTGSVASSLSKERAAEIARSLAGVREVSNLLEIAGGGAVEQAAPGRIDLQAFRERILSDRSLSGAALNVSARGNVLTLSGTVGSISDKERIERMAREVPGIDRIDNQLSIPPALTDRELTERVEAALRANPDIDVEGIHIDSKNGVVTLSGSRPNHRDRDRILSVTLMVEGVREVRSELR